MRVLTDTKRNEIVEIARGLFVEQGYGQLSMGAIAAAVGGSKATLYRYFSGKEELFAAVITSSGAALFADLESFAPQVDDLRDSLVELGCAYLRLILDPGVLEAGRLVIAEAARFPELGLIFYRQGPERTAQKVSQVLATLGRQHGLASLASPWAAVHFMAICQGDLYDQRLWGTCAQTSSEEVEVTVREGVERFLAGYLTPSGDS